MLIFLSKMLQFQGITANMEYIDRQLLLVGEQTPALKLDGFQVLGVKKKALQCCSRVWSDRVDSL